MESKSIALIAAASLALASAAIAQQPAPRSAPPGAQTQEAQLSDADLEKFADIYVDLMDTQATFERELESVETEDQARELQTRMQNESVAKLARHGWTAERYVLVGETIRANPALTEKTVALIEDRD
jgi:hypothetical protein